MVGPKEVGGMKFDYPFYISPHAVTRFQERIAPIGREAVMGEIQGQLQPSCREVMGYARWDKQINPVYLGNFHGKKYAIPTQVDKEKVNAWAVVPTILPMEYVKSIHWEREHGERKWFSSLWEDRTLTTKQIGVIAGVSQATVCRIAARMGLEGRRGHRNSRWSKQEQGIVERGVLKGDATSEIVKAVKRKNPGRVPVSIRVQIHRAKKKICPSLVEGKLYQITQIGEKRKRMVISGMFVYKGIQNGKTTDHLIFQELNGWSLTIPFNPASLREYQIIEQKGGVPNDNSYEVDLQNHSGDGISSHSADGKDTSIRGASL